jgi:hypothetical protein
MRKNHRPPTAVKTSMIVELALLNVRFGESQAFEEAMKQALLLIEATHFL